MSPSSPHFFLRQRLLRINLLIYKRRAQLAMTSALQVCKSASSKKHLTVQVHDLEPIKDICKKLSLSARTDSESPSARRLKNIQMRFRSEEEILLYFKQVEDKPAFEPPPNAQASFTCTAGDAETENKLSPNQKKTCQWQPTHQTTFACAPWPIFMSKAPAVAARIDADVHLNAEKQGILSKLFRRF